MSGNSYAEGPSNQFTQAYINTGKENIIFPKLPALSAQLRFAKRS